MASIFQRHVREGNLALRHAELLWRAFEQDLADAVWNLLPVSDALLRRTAVALRGLSPKVFLRAGDALHLVAAREHGFSEVWTNDRRMLLAAPHLGLRGRSV